MVKLDHPNVLKLIDVIETKEHVCVIVDYASGGDLFELIQKSEKVGL